MKSESDHCLNLLLNPKETNQMRRSTIVAAALTIAIVAILAATAIDSSSLKRATAVPASASIDVMQMMKDAKNLPEEQYDAY